MDRKTEVRELFRRLDDQARESGYSLNPDTEFTMELMEGLVTNLERYGYMACPCRLAEGTRKADLDIICPCDYRDPDLVEHGACYCGLYVSEQVLKGERALEPVPERRPADPSRRHEKKPGHELPAGKALPYPVYRCRVCGYLCARHEPPGKCPVCGVSSDRFERFM